MLDELSEEGLWDAWERVRENQGCAGADAVTIGRFAQDARRRITDLFQRVQDDRYRPYPLLEIIVEKKPGSAATRTLLVPAVRDRILQTWAAHHLSRSFEEEFLECSFAYRPGRGVDRAIARIKRCWQDGYHWVVDADITSFFDQVSHSRLFQLLSQRVADPRSQVLLRSWIEAEYWDGHRIRKLREGVAQGSPISPLFANLFLEDFDRQLAAGGRRLVRYADDFLILARSRTDAQACLALSETVLAQIDLDLNREKTRITSFEEGFRFLGALFHEDAVWIPWKAERNRGRLLSMARPLPVRLRSVYDRGPRHTTMEEAFLHARTVSESPQPRERWDGMAYLYVAEQGAILRKTGDRFLLEKEDEVLLELPYHELECVLLFGNVQVTTQALGELLDKGIPLRACQKSLRRRDRRSRRYLFGRARRRAIR
jgi:group II intron reverse transcriptase/maturase